MGDHEIFSWEFKKRVNADADKRSSCAVKLRTVIMKIILPAQHIARHKIYFDQRTHIPRKSRTDANLLIVD